MTDEDILKLIKSHANESMLKDFIKLTNWFIAHNCSSYKNADEKTKDHIDSLCREYNRRLDLIQKKYGGAQ